MKRLLSLALLALAACVAASPSDGDDTDEPTRSSTPEALAPPPPPACIATPQTYVRPKDDGAALAATIESAGYGAPAESDWIDLAAGNVCGGAEKELVLVRGASPAFSVLRGPTPYPVATSDFATKQLQPWRAVAVGDLDADGIDEIVALRSVTAAGVSELVVGKADPKTCALGAPLAELALGGPKLSDWVDVAVGNFDGGKTKTIAALKSAQPSLAMFRLSGGALAPIKVPDLDPKATYPWRAIAAGDLDGDGIDELVAARQVKDGLGSTILVYKWVANTLKLVATSSLGNTGASAWTGMTVGDWNGDGRASIALVQNGKSAFTVLDLPTGAKSLRVVASKSLDTVAGQDWRGVTSADWVAGDQGAHELLAVRAATAPYRTDLFVYGDAFHRARRDAAIADTKGAWDQIPTGTLNTTQDYAAYGQALVQALQDTHTDTLSFTLTLEDDYRRFTAFLAASQNACVDGRPIRAWATLYTPSAVAAWGPNACPRPKEAPETPWPDLQFFDPTKNPCLDYVGWAATFGKLAQQYPGFAAVQIDDFSDHPDEISPETLAQMQALMRIQAPWMNLLLTVYSNNVGSGPADIGLLADTLLFYFRNDLSGHGCIDGTCGEKSVWSAPDEVKYVQSFLAPGRKLHVGMYWGTLGVALKTGTPRYNFDLMRLLRALPSLGGLQAYPQMPIDAGASCDELHFTSSKYCLLKRLYGSAPRFATHTDLTAASGAVAAAGDPFGYEFPQASVQNIVYRAADDHAHELWRAPGQIGHSDLTSLAGAPSVVGDVRAYVFGPAGMQNAVYRGSDMHEHALWWSTGAVMHDDLSWLAGAPNGFGPPSPWVDGAIGTQNIAYRAVDNHIHGLYWSFGPVGNDDLSHLASASDAASDPFAFMLGATQNALYVGTDTHLHDLHWQLGAVTDDRIDLASGAPSPVTQPVAYVTTNDGLAHAIYRGNDGDLHEVFGTPGGSWGHSDLTWATHAPDLAATSRGFAVYFDPSDGTQHVVYRDAAWKLRELSWTTGGVTDDDLTDIAGAPISAGEPSAYVASDGTRRVLFRTADGHIREIVH